jgi:hypothetical protein
MNLTGNPGQFLYRPGESDNRYSLDACLHVSALAYRGRDPCKWRVHLMLRFFSKISHTQDRLSFWFSLPLKTGQLGCAETLVRNYHYTLRNIPEDADILYTAAKA